MKKISLFLAALLVVAGTIFAGGNRARSSESPAAGGRMPLTISWWWGTATDFPADANDKFGQLIEEKFNVDIKLNIQDWSDYTEKFRLWAAADELPDVFSGYPPTQPWFPEFINQGLIRSIPYSMISRYPNLKKMVDENYGLQEMRKLYGDIYYLPAPLSLKNIAIANNRGIWYRKDWATKLGFTEKITDLDTFYNLLYAYVNNDPDGNGKKDTYGITGTGYEALYAGFGAFPDQWIRESNGKVKPGYLAEEPMVAALSWLRKAYQNGLLDPEMGGGADTVTLDSKFVQNTFGAIIRVCATTQYQSFIENTFKQAHPDMKDEFATVDVLGAISARKGGTVYHGMEFDSCGRVFKADLSDEKLNKILEINEFLLSPEGDALWHWGFKDVDYKENPDGTKTSLIEDLNTKYPTAVRLGKWTSWDLDFETFDSPYIFKSVHDWGWAWTQDVNKGGENARKIVDYLGSTVMTEDRQLFNWNYNTELLNIIQGSGDVRTMYRAFVEEARKRGIQKVIDSVNKTLGR
jgi:hypothetical protein